MSIARDIAAWALATATKKGPIEKATQAEVDASDAVRLLTPETLENSEALPGGLLDIQMFRVQGSFTWTKPAGCSRIEVECVGGGGGGAGVTTTNTTTWRMGGGGGGGGKTYAYFDAANFGATVAVVVGSKGVAGNGVTGTSGGNSSFNGESGSYYAVARGGVKGISASADNNWGSNGAGGTATVVGALKSLTGPGGVGQHGSVEFTSETIFSGSTGGGAPGAQGHALPIPVPQTGGFAGGSPSAYAYGCGGGGSTILKSQQARAASGGVAGMVRILAYG